MLKADSLKNILGHFEKALADERAGVERLQKEIKQKELNISGFKEAIYLVKVDLHKVTGEGDCDTCFWHRGGGCNRLNPEAKACLVDGVHVKWEPEKWR